MLFVSYEELQKHINHNCNISSSALDDVVKYEFAFSCDPENADYCKKRGCQNFCHHTLNPEAAKNFDLISDQPTRKKYFENQKSGWIEIKTRKPTEEEVQEYMNDPYFDIDDPEDLIFFDCQMPEDGQEVLITTSWGNVCIDTYVQEYGAFENHEDHEDVVAWMPLPKPFEKEPEANDRPCEKCKHKVETKPGVEACDVWDCSFEPKDEQS